LDFRLLCSAFLCCALLWFAVVLLLSLSLFLIEFDLILLQVNRSTQPPLHHYRTAHHRPSLSASANRVIGRYAPQDAILSQILYRCYCSRIKCPIFSSRYHTKNMTVYSTPVVHSYLPHSNSKYAKKNENQRLSIYLFQNNNILRQVY
jgi:hypothetical protein